MRNLISGLGIAGLLLSAEAYSQDCAKPPAKPTEPTPVMEVGNLCADFPDELTRSLGKEYSFCTAGSFQMLDGDFISYVLAERKDGKGFTLFKECIALLDTDAAALVLIKNFDRKPKYSEMGALLGDGAYVCPKKESPSLPYK